MFDYWGFQVYASYSYNNLYAKNGYWSKEITVKIMEMRLISSQSKNHLTEVYIKGMTHRVLWISVSLYYLDTYKIMWAKSKISDNLTNRAVFFEVHANQVKHGVYASIITMVVEGRAWYLVGPSCYKTRFIWKTCS